MPHNASNEPRSDYTGHEAQPHSEGLLRFGVRVTALDYQHAGARNQALL
jgi:hypothetical protein